MAFEDYDVKQAFARIEEELISSMMRNLANHLKEESDEGFDWSQWQVEQLKYLEEYRKRNKEKFGPQFADINQKMQEAIQDAVDRGQKDEEIRILKDLAANKKIQRRYANQHKASIEAQGDAFFRVNDNKLEALLTATQNDMEKAEQAVLRRANDQYRKIIFDAQVYANTGAGTVEKAIDMAAKDFLSRGIDSIEYKNGTRHTIKDYADMYIRTAERRAYLMGEGNKRKEWGMSLVLVNKRGSMRDGDYGTACPQCIPWLGKVLIDDVYSDGKPDGKHKLLSEAMAAGFLHPRCKDGFTTYFPGISSTPDPDATKKELKEAAEAEKEEAREDYVDRQEERFERLAENSLDAENQRKYEARRKEWRERQIGRKEENEKQLIKEINADGASTLAQAYDRRRERYGLNLVTGEQLLNNPLGNTIVDYTGVSVETAQAFNSTLEELQQEYLSGITEIKVADKKEVFGATFFARVQANDEIGRRVLVINPHKCSDYNSLVERIRELSAKGHCVKIPEGMEAQYVATHEFAHGLLNMQEKRKSLIGMNWRSTNKASREIKAMYQEYMDEIRSIEAEIAELRKQPALTDFSASAEEQMEAFRKIKEAQDRLNSVKISNYSMENTDEFMAEAFTQNRIGVSRSKYSDRVMEVLDREYKIGTTQRKEISSITQYSNSHDKKKDRIRIVRHSINDWPEDIVTTDTWKDDGRFTPDYEDVTERILNNAVPNHNPIQDITDFVQNGKRYTVDGVNVKLNHDVDEIETAKLLQEKLGVTVQMMPEVNGDFRNVKTPDYLVDGARWDRKGIEKVTSKKPETYFVNKIHHNHQQAENYVFDITSKCNLTDEFIITQLKAIYSNYNLRFVKTIVLTKNGNVLKIFERK